MKRVGLHLPITTPGTRSVLGKRPVVARGVVATDCVVASQRVRPRADVVAEGPQATWAAALGRGPPNSRPGLERRRSVCWAGAARDRDWRNEPDLAFEPRVPRKTPQPVCLVTDIAVVVLAGRRTRSDRARRLGEEQN